MATTAAHLRVFQPLAAFPDAVQARLVASSLRTRAEVEREAAARARRRLLRRPADPFPAPGEDELVRVVSDAAGSAFYCPDELGLRMEMAAAMLEESAPAEVVAAAVPAPARAANRGRALVALEDEWGLSPDPDAAEDAAGPVADRAAHQDVDGDGAHHRVQTRTSSWGLPHAWLAVFDPAEPVRRLVDGETVAYRRTGVTAAVDRAGRAAAVLARHAPESEVLGELSVMREWLEAFHPDSIVELDYAGLTRHVWPDDSVFDLWALLDALDDGDEATAAAAQERLNRRWAAVGMLSRAG